MLSKLRGRQLELSIRIYPSALGPSTSGGTLMTPKSRAAFTASTSGPVFDLPSALFHRHVEGNAKESVLESLIQEHS